MLSFLGMIFGEVRRLGNADVLATFDLLIEEIEKEMSGIQGMLSMARKSRNYERFRSLSQRLQFLSELLQKIVSLREEYERSEEAVPVKLSTSKGESREARRLPKGFKTPEPAFYRPILQSLVEMGGRARVPEVLNRVGEMMKEELNEFDHQLLRSGEPRWRKTAQWARYYMVQKGWLQGDSPRGMWEITEEGRRILEELKRRDEN